MFQIYIHIGIRNEVVVVQQLESPIKGKSGGTISLIGRGGGQEG